MFTLTLVVLFIIRLRIKKKPINIIRFIQLEGKCSKIYQLYETNFFMVGLREYTSPELLPAHGLYLVKFRNAILYKKFHT